MSAESDGLPYLIVDRYAARTLVVQFGPFSTVAKQFKSMIVEALCKVSGCERILERESSNEARAEMPNWIVGAGETNLEIVENDLRFNVDIASGHKTGFYLDQADNRGLFRQYLRRHNSKTVLDLCAYTGAFSVAALAAGASHVTSVESSQAASAQCVEHVQRNFGDAALRQRHTVVTESTFDHLRKLNSEGTLFDAIVLDPPKFAQSKQHVEKACHALQVSSCFYLVPLILQPDCLGFESKSDALFGAKWLVVHIQLQRSDIARSLLQSRCQFSNVLFFILVLLLLSIFNEIIVILMMA